MKHLFHNRITLSWSVGLLFVCSANWVSAQPQLGPMTPYPGALPWDMRQQYYEQIPQDRGGFVNEVETPLDRLLRQAVAQTWFRMDYVQWDLDDVDDDLIGSTVPGVPRPDLGFTITDAATGAPATDADDAELVNYTPRLGGLDLNEQSGLRLTYGLETNYGTVEAQAMWILQDTATFNPGPPFPFVQNRTILNPNIGAIAIPFSVNGLPTTRAVVFTGTTDISYETALFNTEINFLFEDNRPINGFHMQPLIGIRYLRVDEQFNIFGTSVATDTAPGGDASFQSETRNQIVGPQVGVNLELRDDYFTIGARPGFTFGFTHMNAKVVGNDPQSPFGDTVIESQDENNVFAPAVSLSLYTKIRLFENIKLFGGYEILYLDSVSRASDTINYDVVTTSTTPGFTATNKHTFMFNQGFTVGLLFEF